MVAGLSAQIRIGGSGLSGKAQQKRLVVCRFKGKWTSLRNSQEKVLGYNNP
jgi:hypothetical protein